LSLASDEKQNTACSETEKIPIANDEEIVFDSLIVDICVSLKKRHRNFGVANSLGNASHALRKALDGTPCLGRAGSKVEHR
jgi:hypothetical protein